MKDLAEFPKKRGRASKWCGEVLEKMKAAGKTQAEIERGTDFPAEAKTPAASLKRHGNRFGIPIDTRNMENGNVAVKVGG